MSDAPADVTTLLREWQDGHEEALSRLLPLVYAELRRIADRQLRREASSITLQATGLVHEAFLRLVGQRTIDWQGRAHFFGIAGRLMRQVLVDRARARSADKRAHKRVPLDEAGDLPAAREDEELLALDHALDRLGQLDERLLRIVELRYFGGLTNEETAEVLGLSPATVKRDWSVARAWLKRELGATPEGDEA